MAVFTFIYLLTSVIYRTYCLNLLNRGDIFDLTLLMISMNMLLN